MKKIKNILKFLLTSYFNLLLMNSGGQKMPNFKDPRRPQRESERFMGASIPASLYDRVQDVARKEEKGKLKWAVVKLLEEALTARGL